MPSSSLAHVILVSFYADVSQAEREKTRFAFRQLGNRCGGRDAGILYWNADWNLDQRKNFQLMAIAIFASEEVFEKYRVHPSHKEFAEGLSRIADWIVGDMETNTTELHESAASTQSAANS